MWKTLKIIIIIIIIIIWRRRIVIFAVPAEHRVTIEENEKRDRYVDLAWELKNLSNMRVTVIQVVIYVLGMIRKVWKGNWKRWKLEDESKPTRPRHFKIGQTTKKSLGHMKSFAVIQTPVKGHQPMLVGKTHKFYYY